MPGQYEEGSPTTSLRHGKKPSAGVTGEGGGKQKSYRQNKAKKRGERGERFSERKVRRGKKKTPSVAGSRTVHELE